MKQSLIERVGRLVSGAAHQIVDAAEDVSPKGTMEQAIREVEATIEEMENERGRAIARRHLATKRLSEENERHAEIESECKIALEKGRKDLAEGAMGQMLDIESQVPVLEREIEAAREEEAEIEGNIEALAGRRNEMRDEMRRIAEVERASATGADGGGARASDPTRRAASASEAFDRAAERTTGLATQASARSADDARKRAELQALKRSHRIDERLREMQAGQ